ncbi:hypothetical protein E5676_scaffold45G00930 [Cucumis melo var. makuwa]|uniref:Uncharacterized protein n=1 Tax=Cucumis melo var. makuwa TaxID=1194695 RepID=A0A5D3CX74_CUCMM|nr:hypothetical protein E5676_scaffold45G00930 [Cucumis melo var. makuwa]
MVRIGATKCTGQRPTKGKRRRASDEGQTTMGKRRWASDDGQVTMAGVGSGVLHERKEKGKGTYAKEKESMVERRESNVEEGNLRKGIFGGAPTGWKTRCASKWDSVHCARENLKSF